MESSTFWEESNINENNVKYESCSLNGDNSSSHCKEEQSLFSYCDGNLNFSTAATSEDDEYGSYLKKKISRDPMSHRIIEKRRRDRMNNCLADLSRLIPADYVKKGRGRIEKTEIIEMAIKHMKYLQAHACNQIDEFDTVCAAPTKSGPIVAEHYRLGYHECLSETMHFLVEVEGFFAGDSLCVQLISHLQKHCDKILKGDGLNMPRTHLGDTTSGSSNGSFGGDKVGGEGSGASSDGGERRGGEELGFETRGSQLRDILTYPNNRLQLLPESPAPSPLSLEHDHHEQHSSSSNSLYKFKNNIKQRFNSEHPADTGPVKCEALKRRYSDAPPQVPTPTPPPTPSVPIFALHTNGAYYVPLTVTQAALEPFLGELSLFLRPGDTAISLHPVTISVNFSPLTTVVTRQASTPLCQPPHQWHTTVSLPKWTTCNPD